MKILNNGDFSFLRNKRVDDLSDFLFTEIDDGEGCYPSPVGWLLFNMWGYHNYYIPSNKFIDFFTYSELDAEALEEHKNDLIQYSSREIDRFKLESVGLLDESECWNMWAYFKYYVQKDIREHTMRSTQYLDQLEEREMTFYLKNIKDKFLQYLSKSQAE